MLKLVALVIALFPTVSLSETSLSPIEDIYEEEEGRLVWVGFDPNESLEGIPVPAIDHRLKVVSIFEIEIGDVGTTFIDCFVQVEEVDWRQNEVVPIDEFGWPFIEDLDGVLRPIHEVQVDTTTCTSPSGAVGEP